MAIMIAYTDIGPMLGDFNENEVGYVVENPILLQQMGQQLGMAPILGFTTSKKLTLRKEDILYNGELFEPATELRNHWNSQFGSGIVLSTSPRVG